MSVTKLIDEAFELSRSRLPDIQARWITISYEIGELLPGSLLVISIQRVGELDLLLRCMEDDLIKLPRDTAQSDPMLTHYQMMLSEYWVGAVYEFVRLLKERKLKTGDDFDKLAHHLRMLRVPLEKHEIAAHNKLPNSLPMKRIFQDGKEKITYYTPGDELRAHIMNIVISMSGSLAWDVIDPIKQQNYWLERRELSDRIIALF